ncbi:MAG: hypothetical protein HQL43_04880 [Alphaproteobacteria bacterium]|nr:hypothetical protein [Alphaproteobacteria bacterium]
MIGSVEGISGNLAKLAVPSDTDKMGENTFSAALEVARKADAAERLRKSEVEDIRDKGVRTWAGEMQVEQLKKKLREKILKAMGLGEEDLAKMSPAIQQILEQKIQQEIEQQLEAEMRRQQIEKSAESRRQDPQNASAAPGKDGAAAQKALVAAPGAGQNPTSTGEKTGKKCPVIPALSWPGLPPGSLF